MEIMIGIATSGKIRGHGDEKYECYNDTIPIESTYIHVNEALLYFGLLQ